MVSFLLLLLADLIDGEGEAIVRALVTAATSGDVSAGRALLDRLVDATAIYLNAQAAVGAQALQVFDSWVGTLSPPDYRRFVQPHMARLFAKLDPGVPAIHFGTETASLLELQRDAGGTVIGLDWRVDLDGAWERPAHPA